MRNLTEIAAEDGCIPSPRYFSPIQLLQAVASFANFLLYVVGSLLVRPHLFDV